MVKPQSDEVAVLKSVWIKDGAGRWAIHALESIDLKPREGFNRDYFKIRNEVKLLTQQPGAIMRDIFSSFGETEFLLKQSIVPIVAWNEGDREIRCIGTGFFISASGYLMTAAHVLRDPIDENYADIKQVRESTFQISDSLNFGVLIPNNPAARNAPFAVHPAIRKASFFVHPIEWAQHWGKEQVSPLLHEKSRFEYDMDVAVIKVKENLIGGAFQPLNIGTHRLNIGDRAVAIGYSQMDNIPMNPEGKWGEFQHDLFVSVGAVQNVYLNNIVEKQSPTPGPCFDFNAKIPGKMSGSPILVGSGILTKGIVSRSWQDEKHATGCLVAPIMGLELLNGSSLAELMRNGSEGIASVQGADL